MSTPHDPGPHGSGPHDSGAHEPAAPPPPPYGAPVPPSQHPSGYPPPPGGYPAQPTPEQARQQGYPQQGYPQQGYPQQGYPGQPLAGFPGMPGAYGYHPITGEPYSEKSKLVAALLQILIPCGLGRFYIGDTKTGVWQLVVTLVTCGIGALWPFIDGIVMLATDSRDAQGRLLRS